MASSFINSTSFEGVSAFDFYAALLDSEFSSRYDWKSINTIKNQVLVPQVSLANIVHAGEYCDFGATGSVTLSRKSVEVCPQYVNLEFCKKDIEPTFLSLRLKAGQLNGENIGPAAFTDFLINYVKESVLVSIETATWNGATTSCAGGLMGQAQADATVVTVSATASVTAANVLGEVARVLTATPVAVREASDFVLYVSRSVEFLFRQAIGALTIPYFKAGEKPELSYNGYTLRGTPGLTGTQMFGTNLSNLWNINDLGSDEQRLVLVDMTNTTAEPKARVAMAWKFTAAYGIGAEVVIYV
jgi:hypothetical protein